MSLYDRWEVPDDRALEVCECNHSEASHEFSLTTGGCRVRGCGCEAFLPAPVGNKKTARATTRTA